MRSRSSCRSGSIRIIALIAFAALVVVAALYMSRMRRRPGAGGAREGDGSPEAARAVARDTSAKATATSGGAITPAEDFRATLEAARALSDRAARAKAFGSALQRWVNLDPDAALAYVRELPRNGAEYTPALLLTLDAIGRRNPERALELAAELATTREQQAFYSGYFARLAAADPAAAAQQLNRAPAGMARENAVRAIADAWAQRDATAALAWAQTLSGLERGPALENVITELAATDPLRAIQLAPQSLSGASLNRTLSAALHRLLETDPDAAAGVVSLLPAGELQTLATGDVARTLAGKNSAEALAWAKALPEGPARTMAIARVMETWAKTDPTAAASRVASLPDDPARRQAVLAVCGPLTAADPAAAISWAQALPPAEAQAALERIADAWAQRDAAAATRWVAGPGAGAGLPPSALQAALSYWVLQDAAAAQDFVAMLPAAAQRDAAASVAPLLAQTRPTQALAWAQSLPEASAREAALAAAYARWHDNAPAAAAAWLAGANLAPELKTRLQQQP